MRTIEVSGQTMAYRQDGHAEGEPVVLLHALASSSSTWTALTAQ